MKYYKDASTHTLQDIRAAHPNMSIPEGADLSDLGYESIVETARPSATEFQSVVESEPSVVDGVLTQQYAIITQPSETIKAEIWERIKNERERRKAAGIKVGSHWYHSDTDSRIQQLGLSMMGAAVPPVGWKTLRLDGLDVEVPMSQALAGGIFMGTATSDIAIFAAAKAHKAAMEASETPETYDYSAGWPPTIKDEQE